MGLMPTNTCMAKPKMSKAKPTRNYVSKKSIHSVLTLKKNSLRGMHSIRLLRQTKVMVPLSTTRVLMSVMVVLLSVVAVLIQMMMVLSIISIMTSG